MCELIFFYFTTIISSFQIFFVHYQLFSKKLRGNITISMKKDFDGWNKVKKKTEEEQPRLYTVREIWWCRFGVNVGTEQDGRGQKFLRPALILRGFGPDACLVVPLTTSPREHSMRPSIGIVDGKKAKANLSQIRVVDTRRLVEKIGFLDQVIFSGIRKNARGLL
jgi:mRNA interferase MazF